MLSSQFKRSASAASTLLAVLGAAIAIEGVHGAAGATQAGQWVEGRVAPPLRLPTIDGEGTLDLDELRGERVLLLQFASW